MGVRAARPAGFLGSLLMLSAACGNAPSSPALATEYQEGQSLRAQLSLQHPVWDNAESLFRTPVDNPTYAGVYSFGTDLGTQALLTPPTYTLQKFELLFSEAVSTPGNATFARTGELRPFPAQDALTTGGPETGTVISPWAQHGARVGFGNLLVSANQNTNTGGGQSPKALTEPTNYSLFGNTLLVPVTAIIVVPTYASSAKAHMEALANSKFQELLWDDVWSLDTTRNPSTGVIDSVQGNAKQVATPVGQSYGIGYEHLQTASGHVQPDGVWAQCGI
jgi:hypothetical protein